MIRNKILLPFLILSFGLTKMVGQNVSLYKQFGGKVDFTMIGNTMNPGENNQMATPTILQSSSATLNLAAGDVVQFAGLYWAGSGTGDFNIKLNGTAFTADRKFAYTNNGGGFGSLKYFSAFKDVTDFIKTTGNGTYTLSDLDISAFLNEHFGQKTNFAGWCIIVVFKNPNLPINLINVYDGLEAVPDQVDITLNSLNVVDNAGSKIGFLAWEGDKSLEDGESLFINGNLLSNPPLNPQTNAFNGTNSITNSNVLYNMDIDVYNIQNNINVGDATASVKLTSGADVVLVNAIVVKLSNTLPDGTTSIANVNQPCNSRNLTVNYKVNNLSTATNVLPAGTFVSMYANNQFVGSFKTTEAIPIGGSKDYQTVVSIPAGIPNTFELKIIVDNNNGVTSVVEIEEDNNTFTQSFTLTNPSPAGTISYAGPYCSIITTPQAVTSTVTAGGVYNATPTGLNINTTTGAINPSLSTPGNYTVSYTIAASGGCPEFSTTTTVQITPSQKPILQDGFICIDQNNTAVNPYILNSGLDASLYTFQWFTVNGSSSTLIPGQTSSTYSVTKGGIYGVIATTIAPPKCSSSLVTATVTEFLGPTGIATVSSSYFSHEHVIEVRVSPAGNYEYQLDNGVYQSSNVFQNVSPGVHNIQVKDTGGCGTISATATIVDYPNYFTPNNDGVHDNWNIWQLSSQPKSKIYIFDRLGKFLKELSPAGPGWDGNYNGNPLPSTDYWFTVTYDERQEVNKIFRAHFSLRR
jgi:gliding motility-associated-like protein